MLVVYMHPICIVFEPPPPGWPILMPRILAMHTSSLAFLALLPFLANAQISLPILSEPSFNLLPAETIVLQQLGTWGINLSISLDLPVLNSVDVGIAIQPIEPRNNEDSPSPWEIRKEGKSNVACNDDFRRSRLRAKGISLNLGGWYRIRRRVTVPA